MMKSIAFLTAALAVVLTVGGCVERALVITSEPSGADVVVNQQWKGKTPFVLPFMHYGVYDIWIEHPGYEENGKKVKFYPMHVAEPVKAPAYQYAGADFVSEVLLPANLQDQHELHYVLERVTEADDLTGVLDRAKQLRDASIVRGEMRQAKDSQRVDVSAKPPFVTRGQSGQGENADNSASTGEWVDSGAGATYDYYSGQGDFVPGTDIDPTPPDPSQLPVFGY